MSGVELINGTPPASEAPPSARHVFQEQQVRRLCTIKLRVSARWQVDLRLQHVPQKATDYGSLWPKIDARRRCLYEAKDVFRFWVRSLPCTLVSNGSTKVEWANGDS